MTSSTESQSGADSSGYTLNSLQITGPVVVQRVRAEDMPQSPYCIVLVGPTGSGKSSFIEALNSKSPGPSLGIAKNQLEGVTQEVTTYQLKGVLAGVSTFDTPIYIVDTPGFSDPKLSEMHVVSDIQGWSKASNSDLLRVRRRALYVHPITDIRLPNSRRRCYTMFLKMCTELNLVGQPTLVTSMWDQIAEGSNGERNAEARFKMLEAHWKLWTDPFAVPSNVVKFTNSFESAIQILDAVCSSSTWFLTTYTQPHSLEADTRALLDPTMQDALMDRIESYKQRLLTANRDLEEQDYQVDPELMRLLRKEQEDCRAYLWKFVREMADHLRVTPKLLITADPELEELLKPVSQPILMKATSAKMLLARIWNVGS
ncbi:hypothetical protein BJ165DRAFT_1515769 [Panaeolus papilionaceus]|nr:hypothetical protein BJ165DRAFT_1515769 [Panaeolus papilionaceus]